MLNELKRVNEKNVRNFIKEKKRGLHNLEDAYPTSRYFYKVFDEEDAEYLISLAEEVINFCEKLRYGMGKGKDT